MKTTPRSRLVTSSHYTRPARPAPARLFNALAGVGARLDAEALLDEARRSTGLADFGDDSFREPLARLLRSIDDEARLHPLGRAIMRGRIVALLENRLRIEALYAQHPEIASIPIRRPIVIAGLQRTGTTMLHRFLAADPKARALLGWEALSPTPLSGEGRSGNRRRRLAGKLAESGLAYLAPEFFAIHPTESRSPEEDVLLLDLSFTSQSPEATLHVPSYAAWLETQDLVPAYRHLARALKVLAWQRGGEHWVLKTPHHMEYLGELLTVFPDAVIVQTHRDPQATMGSFCSMVAHGRGIFSDQVEPREVGRHWLRKVRRMIDRTQEVRERGAAPFVDVSYYDLLEDPIAQVRRIYDAAGLTLAPEAEAAMRAVLARDVQHRYGKHAYTAADFGLSRATIDETFADYRARHGIRREKTKGEAAPKGSADPTGLGHRGVLSAAATAVYDLLDETPLLPTLGDDVRLDGQTVMVTGANSGLGKALAIDFARRGARVLMAGRSGIPEAGEDVKRASGSDAVEMVRVDLSDLDSVVALTDALAARGETIDRLVCNAGLMPSRTQTTKQGFEVMFQVHYLANHLLIRRLLESGTIPNDVYAKNGRRGSAIPRIVFVGSETHRSSEGLDFAPFGKVVDYGLRDGIAHYGTTKLAALTFAAELGRRLITAQGPSVAVHGVCPGPIDSGITRDAPALLKPLASAMTGALFPSPAQAAGPVVYLAAAPELAGESAWYMHLMRRKAASPAALDAANGARLWREGEALLASRLPGRAAEPRTADA